MKRKARPVLGRPRILTDTQIAEAREYFKKRLTLVQYAKKLKVGTSTLRNAMAGQKYAQPSPDTLPKP